MKLLKIESGFSALVSLYSILFFGYVGLYLAASWFFEADCSLGGADFGLYLISFGVLGAYLSKSVQEFRFRQLASYLFVVVGLHFVTLGLIRATFERVCVSEKELFISCFFLGLATLIGGLIEMRFTKRPPGHTG